MTKNISSFFIGLMMIGSVLLGVYTDFNTGFLLLSEFIALGVFIIVLALPATFIFFGFAIFLVISAWIIIEFSAFDVLVGEVIGLIIALVLKFFWMDDLTNEET